MQYNHDSLPSRKWHDGNVCAPTKRLAIACALTCAALTISNSGMAAAKDAPSKMSMADVLAASPASAWRALDPENTLYLELPAGRVVIELSPSFAPNHIANIKALTRENYFDGLAIVRAQDNYVVQWGDPNEKNPAPITTAKKTLAPEFSISLKKDVEFTRLPDPDGYAPQTGFSNGLPAARDPKTGQAWLTHCYGMIGVGRDNAADSGNGSELYVVIGHAPRHLDRNVTVVGRVLQGMPLLSSLPRGNGPLGFYQEAFEQMPIQTLVVAADLPADKRSKLEVIKTDSPTFKAAVEALRNRGGEWYKTPAGHIEVCNIPPMVRMQK
jgi:peptidylprolyl isomerase